MNQREIRYQVEYRAKNKLRLKGQQMYRVYGIALHEYFDIFARQKGRCAICGIHQDDVRYMFSVDHNHETGRVRGLLCRRCNSILGYINDSPMILAKAFEYVVLDRTFGGLTRE